jgi:electron transport complex protein RnfG
VAAADSAKGEAFRNQFLGLVNGIVVDGEENSIDSMSGATITSKAVTAGVNAALEFVASLG